MFEKISCMLLLIMSLDVMAGRVTDPIQKRMIMSTYPNCSQQGLQLDIELTEYCPFMNDIAAEQANCPEGTVAEVNCPILVIGVHREVHTGTEFWFSEAQQCWIVTHQPLVRCLPKWWNGDIEDIAEMQKLPAFDGCKLSPMLCKPDLIDEPILPIVPEFPPFYDIDLK